MYKHNFIPFSCRGNSPLEVNFIINYTSYSEWCFLARVPWLVVNAHYGILFLLINESITQQNNNHKQFETSGDVALRKYFTALTWVYMCLSKVHAVLKLIIVLSSFALCLHRFHLLLWVQTMKSSFSPLKYLKLSTLLTFWMTNLKEQKKPS